jgi:hypothetical protein
MTAPSSTSCRASTRRAARCIRSSRLPPKTWTTTMPGVQFAAAGRLQSARGRGDHRAWVAPLRCHDPPQPGGKGFAEDPRAPPPQEYPHHGALHPRRLRTDAANRGGVGVKAEDIPRDIASFFPPSPSDVVNGLGANGLSLSVWTAVRVFIHGRLFPSRRRSRRSVAAWSRCDRDASHLTLDVGVYLRADCSPNGMQQASSPPLNARMPPIWHDIRK